ncbi:MetQ/NlpA family lipoprotein [Aquibacillus halophilus]|uniref:Lipoprotein n=1 Tax=Aquibacillus halophilus TaxID=930132 RepID=A0A6A8DGK9_9BACI|nr:MetQ/NlpA family ABC transporter substrate-binding protein [Aquibacillus halophilus]MRH42027.1 MetQ/NlpA family lipoprotein [Aquibacillus halophilus]
MKKVLFLIASIIFVLAGCGGSEEASGQTADNQIKVGVTAGPHEDILNKVKEIAAEDGFEIEVVSFTDYVIPNQSLDEGDLDANIYQHEPFLDNFIDEKGVDLANIAPAVNFPMGIYSNELEDLSELEEGSKVGLPNHSTGEPRALVLFEAAGLITLKEGVGVEATIKDIDENPLNLEFVPLEASQIPRLLDEVTIAAINTNYAMESGRVPTEDSLYMEPKDSPWVNVIASRTENKDSADVQKLVEYYQTDEVKQFIETEFEGSVIPGW